MKNKIIYLTNIQDCIQTIEHYTHEGKQAFFSNKMRQDAVIRNLEIIFDSLAVVGVVGAVGASRCINVRCEN